MRSLDNVRLARHAHTSCVGLLASRLCVIAGRGEACVVARGNRTSTNERFESRNLDSRKVSSRIPHSPKGRSIRRVNNRACNVLAGTDVLCS